MAFLYLLCAFLGGTILVFQFGLALVGLGGDADSDLDSDGGLDSDIEVETEIETDVDVEGEAAGDGPELNSTSFLGALTFRTVTSALAFFGLAGLAARSAGWSEFQAALVAAGFGALAFWAVHRLMRSIARLKVDGTVRIREAVGQPGTVYLRVPEASHGLGKVHVVVRHRTVELSAQSADGEIPTGRPVQIVRVLGPDLVEVAAST
jgi:hypothetical protein